jgi:AcrR family transcriptional regulator
MVRAPRADACRNRDRLLEVASTVFAESGVDASLEKIAKTAGVGIGTLYRHYPTRDALIEAVYRHNLEVLCGGAEELMATKEPDEALEEWMHRWVTYVPGKKGLAIYLKSVVDADSDLFVTSQQRVAETITTLLDRAAAAGKIRPGVNGMDLLRALGGVCLMADSNAAAAGGGDTVVRLLMDGLRYGAPAPELGASNRTS